MTDWLMPLTAALLVACVSLSGAFTLWIAPARLKTIVPLLVSLAVGVLLGDAFVHLIPDASDAIGSLPTTCLLILVGIVIFFVIEKVLRWRHHHEVFEETQRRNVSAFARMNLVGDAIHNFTDGVLIVGSFAVDPWLGATTTMAIVVHEVPQEIGDVGALIQGGYAPRRAVALNFVCSLSVLAGTVVTLIIGQWASAALPYLLPVTAGGFIYIAAADLIPSLHTRAEMREAFLQVTVVVIGISCMLGVGTFEHAILGIGQ